MSNEKTNKKNLLNEAQVRQFMKLASLAPLTPGFVNGLTEKAAFKKGQETEVGGKADESPTKGQDKEGGGKADEEDLEESSGRGSNEYSKPGHHKGGGVKGGGEPIGETMRYRDEEEDLGSELDATEDELGAEDSLADEEGAEITDMDVADEAPADPSLTVRQVVDAIESALEELLPNEQIDAEYIGDDETDVDAEEEFAPEGDDVVADIEMGEEEELEEGEDVVLEKSAREKKWDAIRGGGTAGGSMKADPKKGERESKPWTAAQIKADDEAREKRGKEGRTLGAHRPGKSGRTAGTSGGYGFEEGLTTNADELVEQITKRVAARILKAALAKK